MSTHDHSLSTMLLILQIHPITDSSNQPCSFLTLCLCTFCSFCLPPVIAYKFFKTSSRYSLFETFCLSWGQGDLYLSWSFFALYSYITLCIPPSWYLSRCILMYLPPPLDGEYQVEKNHVLLIFESSSHVNYFWLNEGEIGRSPPFSNQFCNKYLVDIQDVSFAI